jgi:glycosyltransferase involved in cell wall biosynthesis
VAARYPQWQFVMIGPVVKIGYEDLPQAPNLHYLGKKSYEELPMYLAHFDVALIPFALNEATQFLSPTKTLEYMAAHKPVVSTPIRDVAALYGEAVYIADSPRSFAMAIQNALNESVNARWEIRRKLLEAHTWDNITAQMLQKINSHPRSFTPIEEVAHETHG